ncbi:MAG: glycosyltransferase family 4 protein [Firmicutes bacterium]|nr:glycosyltransferase family 4 protein [Bacillota bacterium]
MKKRIVFLNTGTGWGGVEGWHYKTAISLKKRGHKIFVLAVEDTPFFNRCQEAGIEVEKIKKIRNSTFLNPIYQYCLIKFLKNKRIDAIFFCQSSHFKYASIAARLAGLKKIIYRRALAKPINNTFYNRLLLKKCVTHFMAISKVTLDTSISKIPKQCLPEEKIKLIYNGVDLNRFTNPEIKKDIRAEYRIDSDAVVIANIGRLSRQKAQQYFIESLPEVLNKYPDTYALLIGKGSKEELLKDRVEELSIQDKVIFTGFRDDIPSILKQIDFLVHTAIYEGCPWIILEAMMVGVPIVATNGSTLPEFIDDGKNGYLAEDKNPAGIAKKIIKMIENEDRSRMGKIGQETAIKKYSFENMIDNIEKEILLK